MYDLVINLSFLGEGFKKEKSVMLFVYFLSRTKFWGTVVEYYEKKDDEEAA